jgi:hypothetical protein
MKLSAMCSVDAQSLGNWSAVTMVIILGVTVYNSVAWAIRYPGFEHPWTRGSTNEKLLFNSRYGQKLFQYLNVRIDCES